MIYVVIWICFAVIGSFIGEKKGRQNTGIVLGLLLGPIGLIIILAMDGDKISCPHCKTKISPRATSCPRCTKDIKIRKENKKSQTEWSYLKKLDHDLADKKISTAAYTALKNEYVAHKREHNKDETYSEDLDDDVEQRLSKLSSLKEKGLITESEYNEKREEILKSL